MNIKAMSRQEASSIVVSELKQGALTDPDKSPYFTGVTSTWSGRGACLSPDVESDPFFAHKSLDSDADYKAKIDYAVNVCDGCSVRANCLGWAVLNGERAYGVWGGHTEKVRRRIRSHFLQTGMVVAINW